MQQDFGFIGHGYDVIQSLAILQEPMLPSEMEGLQSYCLSLKAQAILNTTQLNYDYTFIT